MLEEQQMGSTLFSPIRLAGLDLSNRIVVAPMCQYSASQGSATDWHLVHLVSLSQSGAGLVVIEGTDTDPRGAFTKNCLALHTDEHEWALRRVVEACHTYGASAIGLQLTHGGRKIACNVPWVNAGKPLSEAEGRWEGVAPSAITYGSGWGIPTELDAQDLKDIRQKWAASAKRAARIGVDSLELHAAHGYFLHQFLTELTNTRDDEYGGTFDKRMRYPLEVFEDVRHAWPSGKPLGIRISGSDWVNGGLTTDQAVLFVERLKQLGCDFVCVSSGGLVPESAPPREVIGPGYQAPLAAEIHRRTRMTVRAVGLISSASQAEQLLASGEIAQVALGRAFLDDPRWGWHAAAELGEAIEYPNQYTRCHQSLWPGSKHFRGGEAYHNTNRFLPRGLGS
jgi:2,4-dienoyl-CoA reductase-like NADH-dependent reductase (Old Yellow Enzyme family)